jgi:putative inorganic carbon (hco3(-)) transporter
LFLYILMFGLAWLNGGWVLRNTKQIPELAWARDLAAMCQVSLVGFAVGGAFLSLTYFDLPYYIIVILIVLRGLVMQQLAKKVATSLHVTAT